MEYGGQHSTGPLKDEERRRLNELIKGHELVFAKSDNDLGECTLEPVRIELEDSKPIFKYPYRISRTERDMVAKEIVVMLESGVIRESKSA